MYYTTCYASPLGLITLASDEKSLVGLWLEGQKYFAGTINEDMIINDELPVFVQTKCWLDNYFAGKRPTISDLTLTPTGSDFRQDVWKILMEIPYGETITYGDIAKRIASMRGLETMSSQAVGGAVGHNPIPIIIPCHRVVGTNGSLIGYAGGIEKKIWLLEHEGVDIKRFWYKD